MTTNKQQDIRIILSGGGTGGHIFPAVAIANKLKELRPQANISFVGAKGKMEMERVPKAGYPIEGLWISGLQRKLTFTNLMFPFKLLNSLWHARKILKRERPDVVIGTGGYASAALLRQAASMGIPCLIQEQNAYAGLTNKWLSGVADRICVAYPGMEKYFPADKLIETGNPVRENLLQPIDRKTACAYYGLDADRPVIFLTGGSLGARTLNQAVAAATDLLKEHSDVQLLWQCGKLYEAAYSQEQAAALPNVQIRAFIDRMDYAYAAADLVISRAGALTIAEICLLGKAALLVPSPNVAEDHQTKNAMALANNNAAIVVKDVEAVAQLFKQALALVKDKQQLNAIGAQAQTMAYPDATASIATEVLNLVEQ